MSMDQAPIFNITINLKRHYHALVVALSPQSTFEAVRRPHQTLQGGEVGRRGSARGGREGG
jgi:hypothetical protein